MTAQIVPAAAYPHQIVLDIIYRDIDAFGHVNNAVYITHMETARIKFMGEMISAERLSQLPLILAEVRCAYRSPAFYGEQLRIGTGVVRFGRKGFDIAHTIETTDGRLPKATPHWCGSTTTPIRPNPSPKHSKQRFATSSQIGPELTGRGSGRARRQQLR